jgi:16S rRNA C967 or C1407 C5-methylase (RsmB/RsmF family)
VPEQEFEAFAAALLRPLPVTFRVNPLDPSAPGVLRKLSAELQAAAAAGQLLLEDGSRVPPPTPLPWYPHGLAWQVELGRKELRKAPAGGPVKALHQWIVTLNTSGSLSRQEAVSMIPPLLLEVAAHHAVSGAAGQQMRGLVGALLRRD